MQVAVADLNNNLISRNACDQVLCYIINFWKSFAQCSLLKNSTDSVLVSASLVDSTQLNKKIGWVIVMSLHSQLSLGFVVKILGVLPAKLFELQL